jgi:diguanylate cyclase (GGDEF)-like protein/PAS domain S-box-containing protein
MRKALRALIVEDSEDDIELLLGELHSKGYEVEFERVETAPAMRASLKEKTWDIILSDYNLPAFDGLQALDVLKASGIDVPFLLISGTIGEESAVAALKAGANDFIVKGKFARLGPAIERELQEAERRREHRRMEQALQTSEELFRTAFRYSPVGICVTSLEGRLQTMSQALLDMLGYTRAELEGKYFSAITHPDDLEIGKEALGNMLSGATPSVSFEKRYLHKTGEAIWALVSASLLRDSAGQPRHFVTHILNVTERRRAEQKLHLLNRELEGRVAERTAELQRANQQLKNELDQREQLAQKLMIERDLLQTLMDNIPDTIYFKDMASRFTRINRAQVKVLGVTTPEDALGKTDLDFFQNAELAQSLYEEEQRIIQSGESLINRVEFIPTADGKPRWFTATKVPIRDEMGNVTGIVGVSRDITKSKQAEDALRQNEERFRVVSWATKDALWDWDLETNQIQWGVGLQKMFHYSSDTAQTSIEWWLDHIHPMDRGKVKRSMDQALSGGMEFWSKEYRFQRKDGTYADLMDRGYILRDEAGKAYRMIGAMMDITERRQYEATIRHQNDMLSSLHHITLNLLRYREVNQLLNGLVEFCTTFLDAPYAEILLIEGETLVVKAATPNLSMLVGEHFGRESALLSWQAFDTREPAVLSDYAAWPQRQDIYNEFSFHALAEFPILDGNQCLGVLAVGRIAVDYEFTLDQIQFGRFFANLTALVLNNAQLREALHEQSIRDSLTGLFNRRYMEETLKREVSRVDRRNHPLGIVMLDVDRFKQFNDTHGHGAGDALLCQLGQLLQKHIRAEDIACRYGGEEFILIMPHTSLIVARQRAEELRKEIRHLRIPEAGPSHAEITASIGVAMYPEHSRAIEKVLQAADAALYRAKREGRDRVVTAEAAP